MAPTAVTELASSRKRKREEGQPNGRQKKSQSSAEDSDFKQKVLVLSSRGVDYRQRHLLSDLSTLIPHSKKDSKLDSKHQLWEINELADLSSCNNALFFEARRRGDLYMWISKTPNGPSARFHLLNAHTMDELKMTGNCLKGSRPIVCFDAAFDSEPHWRLLKEMLTHIFAVPKTARKAKPFIDHVTSFSIADGKIWFRNYQILENLAASATAEQDVAQALAAAEAEPVDGKKARKEKRATAAERAEGPKISLSEIGPRFVLVPVKIFEGSFSGATLFENEGASLCFRLGRVYRGKRRTEWISPTQVSSARKHDKAAKYRASKDRSEALSQRRDAIEAERKEDELAVRKIFA